MADLRRGQQKWVEKTKGRVDVWAARVSSDEAWEAYVKGLADPKEGLTEDLIKSSGPGKAWNEFRKNAPKKVDDFKSAIDEAAKGEKWIKGFIRAFSTPA